MIQAPGSDEAADQRSAHRHQARQPAAKRARLLSAGAAALALIVGGVVAGIELSSPSYPHPWCGPVLAEMHANGGTEADYEATMQRLEQQDGAPVGQLLSDLYNYDEAYAQQENASDMQIMGALSNSMAALQTVGDDLKQINKECGQPASAYGSDKY
jgi:hypothetical protein